MNKILFLFNIYFEFLFILVVVQGVDKLVFLGVSWYCMFDFYIFYLVLNWLMLLIFGGIGYLVEK